MVINSKYGNINFVKPIYKYEHNDLLQCKSQKFRMDKKQSEKQSNLKFEELLIQKINSTKIK